ncbi:MAG: hypothetical protein J6336_06460 [Kiritimatiellae bacterium]|nr:hypothetical protein [Kiritimatiellia bacterium]
MKGLIGLTLGMCAVWMQAAEIRQVFRPERYHRNNTNIAPVQEIDAAAWIWHPTAAKEPDGDHSIFLRFSRTFTAETQPLRFDVSADERFVLLLDGEIIARGPHRGTVENWLYQSYEVTLTPGSHTLEAVVWMLGPHAPLAQMSWRGGFILKAEGVYDKQLTTGQAEWRVAELKNTRMIGKGGSGTFGVGSECSITGTSFITERPADDAFVKAVSVRGPVSNNVYGLRTKGWMLFPTPIPDQLNKACQPGAFRAGRETFGVGELFKADADRHPIVKELNALLKENKPVTIPPNTSLCTLLDLDDYYCAYPELTVKGGKGAEIRWGWAEALKDAKGHKGDRNRFDGKRFNGFCDRFFPDGRDNAFFTSPWWRCGRWCQLEVKTGGEPLTLQSLRIVETRYPTPPAALFACDDTSLAGVQRICVRGMQMCMHEMLFDCPYYEQQMYPGDTRVQLATVSALNNDDRLIRRAITIYDLARRDNGMVPMNFPTTGTQESTTYTLIWPLMFSDYVMWHDNVEWLKARLPGLNHMMLGMAPYENAEGLLENLPGWSFMDWVPEWPHGNAPDGQRGQGISALNNLFYLLALQSAAKVNEVLGAPGLAAHWNAKATALGAKIMEKFWDAGRGMVADTVKKDRFSEHAQCLAILSDLLNPEQKQAAFKALLEEKNLARTTVYFSHYLFQTYIKMGRTDLFLKRLDLWRDYVKTGLRTPLEAPGEARSDCHAWGSHPLLHLHAGVAGVTPASPFFKTVRIAPNPGGLKWLDAVTPHPKGQIVTKLTFEGNTVRGEVTLPADVSGVFEWGKTKQPLHPGHQTVEH